MDSDDYKMMVLDDLRDNIGLQQPVRASLLERLIVKNVSVKKLHPSPDDEFSNPKIGPNYSIIQDYAQKIMRNKMLGDRIFKEPIIVEKLVPSGYRVLNGHHRWMAALKTDIKKVPVQIVNVTPDEAIFKIVRESTRTKCVSFDLDEVLLRDRELRKNAGSLITELRNMGFDVWIYTGEYYSEDYIRRLVRRQHSKVDGIVNGISKKKSRQSIREAFSKKYHKSVHIDNDSVLVVDTQTKEYVMKEVQSQDSNWASEVMLKLKEVDFAQDEK